MLGDEIGDKWTRAWRGLTTWEAENMQTESSHGRGVYGKLKLKYVEDETSSRRNMLSELKKKNVR